MRLFGFYVTGTTDEHFREWVEWYHTKEQMLAEANSFLEDGFEITDYLVTYTREEIEEYF
jgi:hypothetical protein